MSNLTELATYDYMVRSRYPHKDVIELVGPEGYVHGWKFVGLPGGGGEKDALIHHLTEDHHVSGAMLRRGGGPGGSSRSLSDLKKTHEAFGKAQHASGSDHSQSHSEYGYVGRSASGIEPGWSGVKSQGNYVRGKHYGRLPSDRMTSERKKQQKADRLKRGETAAQQRVRQQKEVDALTERQKGIYSQAHTIHGKSHDVALKAAKGAGAKQVVDSESDARLLGLKPGTYTVKRPSQRTFEREGAGSPHAQPPRSREMPGIRPGESAQAYSHRMAREGGAAGSLHREGFAAANRHGSKYRALTPLSKLNKGEFAASGSGYIARSKDNSIEHFSASGNYKSGAGRAAKFAASDLNSRNPNLAKQLKAEGGTDTVRAAAAYRRGAAQRIESQKKAAAVSRQERLRAGKPTVAAPADDAAHQKLLAARTQARARFPAGHPVRLRAERAVRQSQRARRKG